ncbi:POK6 protein, partial [Psophia crepitans]|nr:POK6 protein [Psophia crepitans]
AEGNERADRLTPPVWAAPVPNMFQQARMSHAFFHHSGQVLHKQFHLTLSDARMIVQACPDCQQFTGGPPPAVNPRGLQALQLWQTDVTHAPEFGCLKYVHVSVDTFSHTIWASAA